MKTSESLIHGHIYTRKQLQEMFGVVDATIRTGVFRPRTTNSIWLFVTEHKDVTQTQYHDQLIDEILYWDGQSSGRTDQLIIDHSKNGLELVLFYRETKKQYSGNGFRYEGVFEYVSHSGANPAQFILKRAHLVPQLVLEDLEALQFEEEFFEGGERQRFTRFFERNPRLRAEAIRLHGTSCQICGFDFETMYGERGAGYIEVHHVRPISSLKDSVQVDPEVDMAVVCANCHRIIHRKKDQILTLDEMREIVRQSCDGQTASIRASM